MFEKEYTLSDGRKITIKIPKQRQMNVVYSKSGLTINQDNKTDIKHPFVFNLELVKASTGLSDEEIGDLYETEYREITRITNELLKPKTKKEANDFLPPCSSEEKV